VQVVGIVQEPPHGQLVMGDLVVVGGDAFEAALVEGRALVLDAPVGEADREKLAAHVIDRVAAGLDRPDMLHGQRLAFHLLARAAADLDARVQVEGVNVGGAEFLDHAHDPTAQTGQDRGHQDHRDDTDEDAQHREERAEFVRQDGVERLKEILEPDAAFFCGGHGGRLL